VVDSHVWSLCCSSAWRGGRAKAKYKGVPVAAVRADRPRERSMQANKRIMVVEDDASSRSALAELLRNWGYQPETASNGLEALIKLTTTRPTVVISDLQMPGLSGLELIKAMRRSAPQIRCIVVTADREKAVLAHGLGVVDCLEKPLDAQRLRQDLQRCVNPGASENPS